MIKAKNSQVLSQHARVQYRANGIQVVVINPAVERKTLPSGWRQKDSAILFNERYQFFQIIFMRLFIPKISEVIGVHWHFSNDDQGSIFMQIKDAF